MCYASSLFDLFNRVQAVQGFLLVFRGFGVQVGVAALLPFARMWSGWPRDDQEAPGGRHRIAGTALYAADAANDQLWHGRHGHPLIVWSPLLSSDTGPFISTYIYISPYVCSMHLSASIRLGVTLDFQFFQWNALLYWWFIWATSWKLASCCFALIAVMRWVLFAA